MLRLLVWQWGRRGAGPFYAVALTRALGAVPQTRVRLSLSTAAELLTGEDPPEVALPVATYRSVAGLGMRALLAPVTVPRLARWLRRERIALALCAMPAASDLVMAAALRLAGVPYAVVVHDAALHPGDRFALQIRLQRWLLGGAVAAVALSQHVAEAVRAEWPALPVLRSALPPFDYGGVPPPRALGGRLRLLSFGRLLPYKGLDLLADTLALLPEVEVRVVGSGPPSPALARLEALTNVSVENRWVPEAEVGALLGWADALILSHTEASQSGVAVAAIGAGRYVVSTDVGGLPEQLGGRAGALLCPPDARRLAASVRRVAAGEVPPPTPPSAFDARPLADALRGLLRPPATSAPPPGSAP